MPGRQHWFKWRSELKGVKVKVKLLAPQLDRTKGFMAMKGHEGELISICPDPSVANGPPTGKVQLVAYQMDIEPIQTKPHTFYVALHELELA
jgi:hypothetical protein